MRRIEYRKPGDETYHDLVSAVRRIGSLKNASQSTRTVMGHVPIRQFSEDLRRVNLRVSVLEAGSGTCLLEAETVAPEVIDLLIKALDDPMYRYEPPETKKGSGLLGAIVVVGILVGALALILF